MGNRGLKMEKINRFDREYDIDDSIGQIKCVR